VALRALPMKAARTAMPSRAPTHHNSAITVIALNVRHAGIGALDHSLRIHPSIRGFLEPDAAAATGTQCILAISSIPATSSAPINFIKESTLQRITPSLASIAEWSEPINPTVRRAHADLIRARRGPRATVRVII